MIKFLALSIGIATLPLSQKINEVPSYIPSTNYTWNFKNIITTKPFESAKQTPQTTEQLKQSNWYTNALQNIEQSEYHFKWEEKNNAYCTPNRKQNLRFFYTEDGFSVAPRTTKIPLENYEPTVAEEDKKYKYTPDWKINFNLDKTQVGKGFWKTSENNAEYIADNITVQYINNKEGMRQNFIVQKPLSNKDELNIKFSIKSKLKSKLNGNQLQFFHNKTNILNYQDLKVWDASGKILEAAFKKLSKGKYAIQVNTKNAVYPITIDPISTTPATILESNQSSSNMGVSVASAGDVNGDGYSDIIVGANGYDNGQNNEGAAFVYHGSATGINTTPAATVESNQVNAEMGFSVASAGDVNGDGYSDIIVGADQYDNGETDEGAVFVYHGSATGIITTTAAAFVESNQASAWFGRSVASAGDVNGDGYSDVIVGARLYDNGQTNEGAAFVYHGSATGINTTPAAIVESNQVNAYMGVSVASAGDVNGDGYSDVIVGAREYDNGEGDEGAAFVYHGSATGISTTAAAIVESNEPSAWMGESVASAGDVNGDGYSDVIVGVFQYANVQSLEGAAFVYHGSATGINTTPAAIVESNQTNAEMGRFVASAGDVNGDGYSDVIIGVFRYDNGELDEGAAFLYHGSATGINTTAAAIVESNQADALMGSSVTSAGDVNGDGYSDIIVGAFQYDNGQSDEGAAFVYHGSATGISTTAATNLENNQTSTNMGATVASAGDVNGDGYSDVIIGASLYDNGETNEGAAFVYHGSSSGISTVVATTLENNQANAQMGISVSMAGDVNGDGYSDVIIGAYLYDNGETNEGAAFLYHGSTTGINNTIVATLESNQINALMGYSVASAGDVNGDGYSDVLVGAYQYDNGQTNEGATFVYHGSATGINNTIATTLEGNQATASFGISVALAGDVNGDGYNDVIVGARLFDNGQTDEGAAFVYHGSATGINSTIAATLESNQTSANMGFSVAAAGDVNADGYSDVIVGTPLYDNGQTDEGAAFVYHGSATGVSTTAVTTLESNQMNANIGYSVASAGDVNGDGYSDVIVGASVYDNGQTDEGAAFLHHGSTTGINSTPATFVESNQVNASFGTSVATAGDANGDGYSDVIVGARFYDNGQTDEGAAFVYHGNNPGTNTRNNLRLYNTNLTTPLNNTNFIQGNFGAGLFAKSFLGRDKGKLVWETRLNFNPYSGTPITNSTFFTAEQSSYTDLGLNGVELKNLINKILAGGKFTKLRARVKYSPVTAITGQVYGPWRNVSSIIDANNIGVLPIDLISFNASWLQKGSTAKLDFVTDKENGICCFDIQKSSDGFNFITIATVAAKNTNSKQTYSFVDANAGSKKQYYRLKIKGNQGQLEYSNVQQLSFDKATEILLFPNPTVDVLHLQLNKNYSSMNVQIVNTLGQVVKQYQSLSTQNQILQIPVKQLAAGNYWLQLQNGNDKQVLQFVKQ